jgi:hypothetical protein
MVTYFRYGLPPKMAAILIKPGKHEDKVRFAAYAYSVADW